MIGTAMQVKPFTHLDFEGKLAIDAKPRGKNQARKIKLNRMKENWEQPFLLYMEITKTKQNKQTKTPQLSFLQKLLYYALKKKKNLKTLQLYPLCNTLSKLSFL